LIARSTPYPTQNAGMRAPVGRRLVKTASDFGLRGCRVGSLALKSRDCSIGFGLYEEMEIALDFRVKIASGDEIPRIDKASAVWTGNVM